MTAIFDNLIIGSGIVAYDESKIFGLKIFLAPIEDFAYTVAAVMMIPAIWNSLRSRI
jgi:lycopene cyclase domain-containing protein